MSRPHPILPSLSFLGDVGRSAIYRALSRGTARRAPTADPRFSGLPAKTEGGRADPILVSAAAGGAGF